MSFKDIQVSNTLFRTLREVSHLLNLQLEFIWSCSMNKDGLSLLSFSVLVVERADIIFHVHAAGDAV